MKFKFSSAVVDLFCFVLVSIDGTMKSYVNWLLLGWLSSNALFTIASNSYRPKIIYSNFNHIFSNPIHNCLQSLRLHKDFSIIHHQSNRDFRVWRSNVFRVKIPYYASTIRGFCHNVTLLRLKGLIPWKIYQILLVWIIWKDLAPKNKHNHLWPNVSPLIQVWISFCFTHWIFQFSRGFPA